MCYIFFHCDVLYTVVVTIFHRHKYTPEIFKLDWMYTRETCISIWYKSGTYILVTYLVHTWLSATLMSHIFLVAFRNTRSANPTFALHAWPPGTPFFYKLAPWYHATPAPPAPLVGEKSFTILLASKTYVTKPAYTIFQKHGFLSLLALCKLWSYSFIYHRAQRGHPAIFWPFFL